MEKSLPKRMIALILVIAMITTTVEWSEIAAMTREIYASEDIKKESKEVVKSENTKNSTTFQFLNGKKQTIFYGQDVRFETEDGTLKDYDPTLVKVEDQESENGNDLKDYAYENESGDKKHYLPKKLDEQTPVLMENGKYEISFAPIYGQDTEESQQEEQTKDTADTTDAAEQAVAQADKAVQAVTDGTKEAVSEEDSQDILDSVDKLQRTGLEDEKVEDAEGEVEEKPVKVSYESEKKRLHIFL